MRWISISGTHGCTRVSGCWRIIAIRMLRGTIIATDRSVFPFCLNIIPPVRGNTMVSGKWPVTGAGWKIKLDSPVPMTATLLACIFRERLRSIIDNDGIYAEKEVRGRTRTGIARRCEIERGLMRNSPSSAAGSVAGIGGALMGCVGSFGAIVTVAPTEGGQGASADDEKCAMVILSRMTWMHTGSVSFANRPTRLRFSMVSIDTITQRYSVSRLSLSSMRSWISDL